MRVLDGMEMVCFGAASRFTLRYAGKGLYLNGRGEPVEDLMDMACYTCTASYYTRESDAIPFCPNCGDFERKRFENAQELSAAVRGQTFPWVKQRGLQVFMVKRPEGQWELRFAPHIGELKQSGRYFEVIELQD